MGVSLKDLLEKTSSPERVRKICLNGKLRGERDALLEELDALEAKPGATMAGDPRATEIAEQVKALEAEMADSTVTFRFRGLSHWRLKEIKKKYPSEDTRQDFDVDAAAATIVAECLVEPKLTEDEVKEFTSQGNERLMDELFSTAWLACHQENDVPKSVRASALSGGNA